MTKPKIVQLNVRVPASLKARIDREVRRRGGHGMLGPVIRRALEMGLRALEEESDV